MKLKYKILFKEGLHSRPAIALTELSKEYKEFNLRITQINKKETNIKTSSLIAILTSNIKYEDVIEITFDCFDNEIKEKLDKIFLIGE